MKGCPSTPPYSAPTSRLPSGDPKSAADDSVARLIPLGRYPAAAKPASRLLFSSHRLRAFLQPFSAPPSPSQDARPAAS